MRARWVCRRPRWPKTHRAVRSERPRRRWARARWTEARRTEARSKRSAVSWIVAGRKVRQRALFRRGSNQKRAVERIWRSERVLGLQRVRRGGEYFSRWRAPFAAVARPPPRRPGYTPRRPRCFLLQRASPSEADTVRSPREVRGSRQAVRCQPLESESPCLNGPRTPTRIYATSSTPSARRAKRTAAVDALGHSGHGTSSTQELVTPRRLRSPSWGEDNTTEETVVGRQPGPWEALGRRGRALRLRRTVRV